MSTTRSDSPLIEHAAWPDVLPLVRRVCDIAGDRQLVSHLQAKLHHEEVDRAVGNHDSDALFEWLLAAVSYQGIGDAAASSYMEGHGRATAEQVRKALGNSALCPRLRSYWNYEDCRYHKGSGTCAEPEHIDSCHLPRLDLRNGRLNQTAFALFLFVRDVAQGDLVGWMDHRLSAAAAITSTLDRADQLRRSLLEPLGFVHGISDKVISMALADLLLGADPQRPLWLEAGAAMVAIDSLVHNWLHRTGILGKLGCEHPYGLRCYGTDGCRDVVAAAAMRIDARDYNPAFPATFPRFVQHAIWSFCAQGGLSECNGNRIDDRFACTRQECVLVDLCEKRALHPQNAFRSGLDTDFELRPSS